jgi:hypothetical protein
MRRVRKLGRRREVAVAWIPERGEPWHSVLRRPIHDSPELEQRTQEGLLAAMLDQLGLTLGELLKGEE